MAVKWINKFPFSKVAGIFSFRHHHQVSSGFPHSPTYYVPRAVFLDLEASGVIYFRLPQHFLTAIVALCLSNILI
jgi:hypothetical protein